MEHSDYIDGYCERVEPGLWAEPVNAVTNIAFVIAAIIVAVRPETRRHVLPMALSVLLFLIGIGSGLFHTFATRLSALADVIPIILFVLTYLYAANRYFWQMRALYALGMTVMFFPYAWIVVSGVSYALPWIGSSTSYLPIALLIFAYAFLLRNRLPLVAKQLLIGALILSVSLGFRWLDGLVCGFLPLGTHFLWHILNAIMLAWMIYSLSMHLSGSESRLEKQG